MKVTIKDLKKLTMGHPDCDNQIWHESCNNGFIAYDFPAAIFYCSGCATQWKDNFIFGLSQNDIDARFSFKDPPKEDKIYKLVELTSGSITYTTFVEMAKKPVDTIDDLFELNWDSI